MTTAFHFCAAKKKKQQLLDPNAQRLILELATVNRIQNEVAYANAFDLRSFKLYLRMEEEERA
jgi:hypothetical protein